MAQFSDINYIEFLKYRNKYLHHAFLPFLLINPARIYVVVYNIDVHFNWRLSKFIWYYSVHCLIIRVFCFSLHIYLPDKGNNGVFLAYSLNRYFNLQQEVEELLKQFSNRITGENGKLC